jgi:hypothetical protein
MGNVGSLCVPKIKSTSKPQMITIEKRNENKTKEEIREDLLKQLAYMKERINKLKTDEN